MTPRVLLAWEGGAGRGHISTLRTIARALDGLAICDAAVNNMQHAAELAAYCDLVFPGSAFGIDRSRRTQGGDEPICSWADHLAVAVQYRNQLCGPVRNILRHRLSPLLA
jgi:hypothetical protein